MQKTQEMQVWSLGQEDPLEEGMATHSSIIAWRISWTEEPGTLQSIVSTQLDTTEQLSMHTHMHTRMHTHMHAGHWYWGNRL